MLKISIFYLIKKNLYLIIPIVILSLWALISLIKDNFSLFGPNDFPFFYYGGKYIYTEPEKIPFGSGFYWTVNFAVAFSLISLFEYKIALWIFFFIIYIFGVLLLLEFNKILELKNVNNKFNRFLFLLVICNGIYIFQVFDYLQKKFISLFLLLLLIRREIEIRTHNNNSNNLKFQIIQFNILIFALGMEPQFSPLGIIYLLNNMSIKSIFSKDQLKKYTLVIIIFIGQNFMFLIYPNLIFRFLEGVNNAPQYTDITNIHLYTLTPEIIVKEKISIYGCDMLRILLVLNINVSIVFISLILIAIFTIAISFKSNILLEKKIGYFCLFSVFFSVYVYHTIYIIVLPLITLLFIGDLEVLEDYLAFSSYIKYMKKNRLYLLGLFCIAILTFNIPLHIIYRTFPFTQIIPIQILVLGPTFGHLIITIDLYIINKKNNENLNNLAIDI